MIGRSDTWDVRLPGTKLYVNKSYLDTPRLGVGVFTIDVGSPILSGSARVHLLNATVTISLKTKADNRQYGACCDWGKS
eukprot:m.195326 g.195326  ORF g.195326 m.195326 type:complete len:79 (+) comp15689_c0_seq1:189-425(+)